MAQIYLKQELENLKSERRKYELEEYKKFENFVFDCIENIKYAYVNGLRSINTKKYYYDIPLNINFYLHKKFCKIFNSANKDKVDFKLTFYLTPVDHDWISTVIITLNNKNKSCTIL